MRVRKRMLFALLPLATVVWFTGCGTPTADRSATPPTSGQASHDDGDHDHAMHDHGDHDHAPAGEVDDELAKLSPQDRGTAEKQRICPVTDELLGSMGVPRKVTIDGHEVFICCEGCEESLKKDPEKYLAKLPE